MKRIICIILSVTICLWTLAACADSQSKKNEESGESSPRTGHQLFYRDNLEWDEVSATFSNSSTGESEEIPMEPYEDGEDYTYTCFGDTEKYNKVAFTYDGRTTMEYAFNDYVSGWYNSTYGFIPYTEGAELDEVVWTTEIFDYNGYPKEVYIWTPVDYDAGSKEKYAVIYLADGQWMLDKSGSNSGCWNVAESVNSMMALSDNKTMIVAVETPESTRYKELVPDIGDVAYDGEYYENGEGAYFCDFVCNTLMPYIEEHYNVYTDPAHNAIAGSSLGGAEAFYIGMEHPEKFGMIGAFSPSFWLYDDETWESFLNEKDFADNYPFVYLYTGGGEPGTMTDQMQKLLLRIGWPEDRIASEFYPKGEHFLTFWRAIFPEFLRYMFP